MHFARSGVMLYAFAFLATNVLCCVLVLPGSVTETQARPDKRGTWCTLLALYTPNCCTPFLSGPSCVDSRALHEVSPETSARRSPSPVMCVFP